MFEKLKVKLEEWMHPQDSCPADTLFQQLFVDPISMMDMAHLGEVCGVDIGERPLQVGIVRLPEVQAQAEQLTLLLQEVRKTSDSDEVLAVSDGVNQIVLVFFRDTLWEDQSRQILDDLRKAYRAKWSGAKLCITLGEMEEFHEDVPAYWRKSFITAVGLQDYRYVKPNGKVIAYTDIIERRNIYPEGIHFRFDLIKNYLENENPELLHGWLSGIYSVLGNNETGTFGMAYHITLEIIVNAISLFRENGLQAEEYVQSPDVLVFEVLSLTTPLEMQEYTLKFLDVCRDRIALHHRKRVAMDEDLLGE